MKYPSWLVDAHKLRNLFVDGAAGTVNGRNVKSITQSLYELEQALEEIFGSGALPPSGSLTAVTLPKGTLKAMPGAHYQVAPVLGTATNCHAAISLTASAQDIATGITNPDCPRNLSIKGNAASEAGDVVITGTDFSGAALTETIALNEANEVQGTKAFKTVTNIHVPALTTAGDTVSVGFGEKLGMPQAVVSTAFLLVKLFDGSADGGTLTASATLPLCVYALAGTADGVKKVDLYYLYAL